jgi:hypothetical protein
VFHQLVHWGLKYEQLAGLLEIEIKTVGVPLASPLEIEIKTVGVPPAGPLGIEIWAAGRSIGD